MNKGFAIIGGDLRLVNLANMLANDKNNVYIYGLEKAEEIKKSDNLIPCKSSEEAIKNADYILSSIPFSKNGKEVYAPFSKNIISIEYLANYVGNKTFLAGSIPEHFTQLISNKNVKTIDLMNEEDLTILNTIATAEGAISEAILNTSKNIQGSNVLILGFGRVAKVLAKKFVGLDANVTCAARKEKDFAWMETLGYNNTNINELGANLQNYDIIVNTVPHLILDEEKLKYVKKDCLLLDLASKPGGIDEDYCKRQGLKFIWALALPGKVAPVTSAKYIKNTIYNILREGDDN